MFTLNDDLSIYATRGDVVFFSVSANDKGKPYTFQPGDIVRFKMYGKKDAENVVLQRDFPVGKATDKVQILLEKGATKIGEIISKPKDYWYEVVLNEDTNPQTIIGYDDDGAKVFKLFPEGNEIEDYELEIEPEDIPIVDAELDMNSHRPIENQAVSRAIVRLDAELDKANDAFAKRAAQTDVNVAGVAASVAVEKARIDNFVAGATAGDEELVDIRVGAYGETYSTAGDAVRSTEAAVFETVEVQHNVFNPANTTRQNVFEYDHIVSDIIPCSAGDVVYVRVGEDLSILSRFGVCYVGGDGELVYPTATAYDNYTIEKPESFAELAGIKVLVREGFVSYYDRDTIMVTINEAPTEFVEWTKDGKRKVSRINKLEERLSEVVNPDNGLASIIEFEKKDVQNVAWYDSFELYANEAYPTTYGNFYYSPNWSGVTYAPCGGAKAVNVLICGGGKDNHRGFVFYDADKNPIKGYVFPTTDEGTAKDATYPVPDGAVYYQTCINNSHKANFYAYLVMDTNIKLEMEKEIARAMSAENKINGDLTLADKKVLIIGDSISTDYYGGYEKWVTKLIKQGFFSADKVTNDSIHATGFVASLAGDKTDCFLPRLKAVVNPAEYDIVVVFGGINDYLSRQSQSVTFDDFASAVDSFFEYLTKTFVNARICVFRPLRTQHTWDTDEGKYQQDYSEYINTVAKSYCLPVLNLTEESGFYPWINDFKNRWTFTDWVGGDGTVGDGVHPSEEWEETRLAPMVKSFLRGLIQ